MIKKDVVLLYPELSYKVTGILFKIHNTLGRFRSESQYGDALEEQLQSSNIQFEREKILPASFLGEHSGRNKIDFLVANTIIVEIKAKPMLNKNDYYQIKRYLTALEKPLGLLVNFRQTYLHPKRIIGIVPSAEYSQARSYS